MRRSERIHIFVSEIWQWYSNHKRVLPWRDLAIGDDTQRAYMVLVSEVMLQQTQVERVKIVFKRFLLQFPHIDDLAGASNRDVILAWRGMGYNSRALRLRDCTKAICELGTFSTEMSVLQSLPGVGHYTAAAVRNFAFNLPTPCLDTNIRRILHRTFVGSESADGTWKASDAELLKIAGEVLDEAVARFSFARLDPHNQKTSQPANKSTCRAAADWHAALMDFGSLVCTKTNPKWDICPLTKRGICKGSYKTINTKHRTPKKEPGRTVGSKFIPNRIFRGRIVDELRDEPSGLVINEIGRRVCIDWSPNDHEKWLRSLIEKLMKDQLLCQKSQKYLLAE